MRSIKRKSPVKFKDPVTGITEESVPEMSNEVWLNRHPLNDKSFTNGIRAISAGLRIQDAYRGDSEEILIEEADYELLKKAVTTPEQIAGQAMSPEVARQCYGFMEAIVSATPVKKVKETPPRLNS